MIEERIFIGEKECLGEKNVWNGWVNRQNSELISRGGRQKKKAGERIFIEGRPCTLVPISYGLRTGT